MLHQLRRCGVWKLRGCASGRAQAAPQSEDFPVISQRYGEFGHVGGARTDSLNRTHSQSPPAGWFSPIPPVDPSVAFHAALDLAVTVTYHDLRR